MSVRWHTYPDPRATAQACAHHITGILEEVLSGQDHATLGLSGGSTPKLMFEELVASKFRWDRVHLFWVDERCVPPGDPLSNYGHAEHDLINPAHISPHQIHRIYGELLPSHAADRYRDEIREFFALEQGELPHFDIIHLGTGPDAHTASLFPGEPLIDDRDGMVAPVYAARLQQWRVTMLPGVLMNAKHTVFLVAGADKADAVRAVFREEYDPKKYPAQMASHHGRRVAWFLDQAAAAQMD